MPIAPHSGGGRPRLYCCAAHRAAARRLRLARPREPRSATHSALRERARAIAALADELLELAEPRSEELIESIRADATARVLRAQQAAADAARRGAQLVGRLESQRRAWEAAIGAITVERDQLLEHQRALHAQLEGTQAALDAELLAHHRDVDELTRQRSGKERPSDDGR